MQTGFLLTRSPVFFLPKERILSVVHTNFGCDIFANRWWQRFLPGLARYVIGLHCVACNLLMVDYGKKYTWKEGKEISEGLLEREKSNADG
jgi:hypothetical protein